VAKPAKNEKQTLLFAKQEQNNAQTKQKKKPKKKLKITTH
jgi:hypothetical protein